MALSVRTRRFAMLASVCAMAMAMAAAPALGHPQGAGAGHFLSRGGQIAPNGLNSHVAGVRHSHRTGHGQSKLVFDRQICDSVTDPCWEIVVSNAHEGHARVVAGPYPRSVWDDHFIANWAPDARSVIFMADLGTGQAIWQVRTDGTDLHTVFKPSDGTFLDDGPAFTPDGRHIIFTRCCQPEVPTGYSLWEVSITGDNLTPVTDEAVPSNDGPSDNLPQVSPNGFDVTYHRNVEEENRISIAPISTGAFTDVTDPALDAQIPNWSPDGRHLVFQTDFDGANIWRVNRDGSHPTALTDDGSSLNPSYAPDGHIIFTRIDETGGRDIWVMRADGSYQHLLRATDGIERFPHLIDANSR